MGSYASAPLNVAAQMESADATASQGRVQANVSYQNKSIAEIQAHDALARGQMQAASASMRAGKTLGAQRAAYGASGVDVNSSGSAQDTYAETTALSEFDKNVIRNNAAREAWGYDIQAIQYGQQARLTLKSSGDAANAQRLAAYGTAVTAVGNTVLGGMTYGASNSGGTTKDVAV